MKVFVVGSGGREHAILWTLRKTSGRRLQLCCAPGNAGIAQIAECVDIGATDVESLAKFAESDGVDLTIVGPEAPLAAGIVDEFQKRSLPIAGPSKMAARLESSKVFAKDFMARHHIPTARYKVAATPSQALKFVRSGELGADDSPVVIKADGLAGGKGVVVAGSREEAERAINDLMSGSLVGVEAAAQIVIEEALQGTEASLLLFSDGRDYALMPAARDHKRIGENDTGPNTGGMGAITDASVLSQEMQSRIVKEIVEPTLAGARAEGFPFRGVLFIGLMLAAETAQVLEYNVRFGDPEAQAILPRLKSDLGEIFEAIAAGTLRRIRLEWLDNASACVVLASRGYPGKYDTGAKISGLGRAESSGNVVVFHAGTGRSPQGDWLAMGGRVLGVTATGPTLDRALSDCYGAVGNIHWEGVQYRRDIGRFKEG